MSSALDGGLWHRFSRLGLDPVIALAIFCFAAFWGARFVSTGTVAPQFYQGWFAPAVMEACGHGYVPPFYIQPPLIHPEIPSLDDFLKLKQATFSCDQIPPDFKQGQLTLQQKGARYLMESVAMNWRLTGISWSALLPLYGLLFGVASAAVYGIFRLGMGKAMAAVLSIAIVLSPLQLNNLPHLRDYAKAPFILIIVMLLGWLVKYSLSGRNTVLLCALMGAVLGIGIGFRMDLLIFIPAVFATLMAFTPSGFQRDSGVRLAAIGAFFIAFIALGWPILLAMSGGGNTFHVILLGLFTPFDLSLNIQPSDFYEWGYRYNDSYVHQILNGYVHRLWGVNTPIGMTTHAYEQAGMAYYFEILRQFPADIVTRIFAAVLRIAETTGPGVDPISMGRISPVAILLSLLFMAIYSLRLAIFSLFVIVFLGGYPALQFSERHFFHLQAVPLFFFGFLGQQILDRRWNQFERFPLGAINRVALFLILLLAAFSVYFGLRWYQQSTVSALLKNYEHLPIEDGSIEVYRNVPDGVVSVRPSTPSDHSNSDKFPLHEGYWGLELDGSACGRSQITVQIRYRFSDSYYDSSRLVVLDTTTPLRYLFHTYSTIGSRYGAYSGLSEFEGIELSEEEFSCIKKFGKVGGFEKLPLLLNLTFKEGWQNGVLAQTIGRETSSFVARRVGITLFTFPETLGVSRSQADELLGRISRSAENLRIIDKSVTVREGVVTVKEDAPSAFAYALQLPAEKSKGGRYLVAEGEVFEGGLTLGLLKNNQWAGQANITTAGKFKIVMKPDAGDYTAILAHNVPNQKFNHFKLTKLGWVRDGEKADDDIPSLPGHPASSEKPAVKTFIAFPDNLPVSEKQVTELLAGVRIPPTNTPAIDKTVTITNGAVTVKGDAPSSYSYALGLRPEKSSGGRYLVAEGELFDGGLTLGLLRNNAWAGQTNVTTPGKFKIVMKPEAGEYTAMLAHNVPGKKFNNFRLTKLGWSPEIK
jgi:hypothetical protein